MEFEGLNLGRGKMAITRYIISDLHLGAGTVDDNFDQDENCSLFIESITGKKKAELIINGDFIDFVEIPLPHQTPKRFSRLGNTEDESREKLRMAIEGHPEVFKSLRRFVDSGNRLVIVPGNHDIDFFWPGVREDTGFFFHNPGEESLYFELSGIYRADGLYVEHGNQYFADSIFENFTNPFIKTKKGELRLERSWSNCFLMYFTDSMRRRNPFIDNVKPISTMVFMGIQEETLPIGGHSGDVVDLLEGDGIAYDPRPRG